MTPHITASQPVSVSLSKEASTSTESPPQEAVSGPPAANRHRLRDERLALTHHFSVGGHDGYLIVGLYPNGQPGEMFIRMAKEGSTIAGLMECFGVVVSVALQHGVPLKVLCDKLSHTRFEPSGWTGSEELGYAKSLMDYIFRWMELRFLSGKQLTLFTTVDLRSEVPGREPNLAPSSVSENMLNDYEMGDAPLCSGCGVLMVRNGSCYRCLNCGSTGGCS